MEKRALAEGVIGAAVLLWAAASANGEAHSGVGCSNCHAEHRNTGNDDEDASWGVPMWSTKHTSDGLPTFTLYSSERFAALGTDIGQPDGASKLCLGCHDGSYAAFGSTPDSEAIFRVDSLSKSHPISFTYDATLAWKVPNGELQDPSVALSGLGGTIQEDLLDEMGKMQCTSCHDVHVSGIGDTMLRYAYDVEAQTDNVMCLVCHHK